MSTSQAFWLTYGAVCLSLAVMQLLTLWTNRLPERPPRSKRKRMAAPTVEETP